jgi:hypothetical protein
MLSNLVKTEMQIRIQDEVLMKEHDDQQFKMIKRMYKHLGSKKCECGKTISMNKLFCMTCFNKLVEEGKAEAAAAELKAAEESQC